MTDDLNPDALDTVAERNFELYNEGSERTWRNVSEDVREIFRRRVARDVRGYLAALPEEGEEDQPTSGFLQVQPRFDLASGSSETAYTVSLDGGLYHFQSYADARQFALQKIGDAFGEGSALAPAPSDLITALSHPQQADGPPKGEPGED